MPLSDSIRALRERTAGHAVYILDPPEDRCAFLRSSGFGILMTVPAFHREHPHCAYLFGQSEGQEGQHRTQTLVLPSGSLKRTQIMQNGQWVNESEYCCRPHHWAKLGLHLSDLTAVPEHYPAHAARAFLEPGDLLAVRLPASPLQMLLREFTSAAFLDKTQKDDPASLRKALRQTEPFFREALKACSDADCDLYLEDADLDIPVPESCSELVRNEYRDLKNHPVLILSSGAGKASGTTVLSLADPAGMPQGGGTVLLADGWKEHIPEWNARLSCSGESVFLVRWEKDSLPELTALTVNSPGFSCEEDRSSVQ